MKKKMLILIGVASILIPAILGTGYHIYKSDNRQSYDSSRANINVDVNIPSLSSVHNSDDESDTYEIDSDTSSVKVNIGSSILNSVFSDLSDIEYDGTPIVDITDDMILNHKLGQQTLLYSANYMKNGIKLSVDSFNGLEDSWSIKAEKESTVTFHYDTNIEKDSIKLVLIIDKKIVEIPYNKDNFTYTLPKGDTTIALVGYKAKGNLKISINPVDGVSFYINPEW